MKKILAILLCILCTFCACGGTGGDFSSGTDGDSSGSVIMATVRFQQDGQDEVVKTVEKGQSLTDIPTPQGKTGYTVTWSVTDFSNISGDMTVVAVEEPKTYQVTLKNGNSETIVEVEYDDTYAFEEPTNEDYVFAGWKYGETTVLPTTGVWKIDADNIVLVAKWGSKSHSGNY